MFGYTKSNHVSLSCSSFDIFTLALSGSFKASLAKMEVKLNFFFKNPKRFTAVCVMVDTFKTPRNNSNLFILYHPKIKLSVAIKLF